MPLKIPFPVLMNPFQILSPASAIPLPRFFPSPTLKNVMAAPAPNTFLVVFVIAVGSGGIVVVGWMGMVMVLLVLSGASSFSGFLFRSGRVLFV